MAGRGWTWLLVAGHDLHGLAWLDMIVAVIMWLDMIGHGWA